MENILQNITCTFLSFKFPPLFLSKYYLTNLIYPMTALLASYVCEWEWLFKLIPATTSLSIALNWSQRRGVTELPISSAFFAGSKDVTLQVSTIF